MANKPDTITDENFNQTYITYNNNNRSSLSTSQSMPSSPPTVPIHENVNDWNSHEMHQRNSNGFQKLHSYDPSPVGTPPINEQYYSPSPPINHSGTPYYNVGGQPPQPYYNSGLAPPPLQAGNYYGEPMIGQQYPLIQTQPAEYEQQPYGYPSHRNPLLRLIIGPIQTPIFSYISAIAMAGALIYEFVRFHELTGDVIETNPFNPMIGPSFQALVNVGARFTPCIRPVPSFPTTELIGNCYKLENDTCTVEQLCGFDGFKNGVPDQSFRFVIPIFLHAGVVHFLLNMLTHLRLGVDLERALGTLRYMVLYMASGIWGFVLSAMFSPNLTASTGCSGALFGLIGYMFIDILVNWKFLPHPVRDLIGLLISTIISLVLGLLPGLDNFAHIGGFVVGIFMGMLITPMRPMASTRVKIFTWVLRFVALAILVVLFAISIREFYSAEDPSKICPNCRYLSCLPVYNWCDPV
ncbi:MAG: rhomboid family-domain-containing protein [Benjaminiella poitrasii]|nr:MAG: rhomboid family-domain-containing protein [Benjaminiella poitrasii]